jgi:alkylation response protein AidB-like acyl-CoA dehydrogenase
MLSKVFGSRMARSTLMSKTLQRQAGMIMNLPKRGVSLLINDQFLEEDQKLIQKTAYDFADQELAPHAAEWDETKHFPMDVYKKAAELGFAGIYVDEKYGGCGLGRLEAALIFEGLATGKFIGIN